MARLDELFRYCQGRGGSDLHLATGLEPRIRRHGQLEAVEGWPPLDANLIRSLLRQVVREDQWRDFEESGDLDFAYGLEGVARFRCNFLDQHNGPSAVFRAIPQEVVPLDRLGLPAVLGNLAHLSRGLVLITGPTGSGKSTTLAAILHEINRSHARHVVTIEEPVEFLHSPLRAVFSQREVGVDTDSFSSALRAALRQDADVILVGEMRDLETISLAVSAAEMGSLVFGTLHTNGAANTVDRLIDVFPPDQQAQIRVTLADSLAAVVSQTLLPTTDGTGRAVALEILLRTTGLPNVIREGNTPMIRNIIQGGRARGMQLMDDALEELVRSGRVAPRDAYLKATDKGRFERYLAG